MHNYAIVGRVSGILTELKCTIDKNGGSALSKLKESIIVKTIQTALHYGVATFIAILAGVIFIHTIYIAFTELTSNVLVSSLVILNNLFFVIILLEVLSTIVQHPESGDFALRPFLTVGIISAVRHILMVGASVSVDSHGDSAITYLIDLGAHGLLTLILVIAYWIATKAEFMVKK